MGLAKRSWARDRVLVGGIDATASTSLGPEELRHYVHALLDELDLVERVPFIELEPDGYDHIVVSGDRYRVPRGWDTYRDRLVGLFPDEAVGLHGYFDAVAAIANELSKLPDSIGIGAAGCAELSTGTGSGAAAGAAETGIGRGGPVWPTGIGAGGTWACAGSGACNGSASSGWALRSPPPAPELPTSWPRTNIAKTTGRFAASVSLVASATATAARTAT